MTCHHCDRAAVGRWRCGAEHLPLCAKHGYEFGEGERGEIPAVGMATAGAAHAEDRERATTLPTADWAALAQHYAAEAKQAREAVTEAEQELAHYRDATDLSPGMRETARQRIPRIEIALERRREVLARAEATAAAMRVMAEAQIDRPTRCPVCRFQSDYHGKTLCTGGAEWMFLAPAEFGGNEAPQRCPLRTTPVLVMLGRG